MHLALYALTCFVSLLIEMGFAACVCGVKRTSIIHVRKRQCIFSEQAAEYSCSTQVTGVHIPIGSYYCSYTKLTSNFAFPFSVFCGKNTWFGLGKHGLVADTLLHNI